MRAIGELPNVAVKIGGLGMECVGSGTESRPVGASSEELAQLRCPTSRLCIEAVGAGRRRPRASSDRWAQLLVSTLWNTFKRITAGASAAEKGQLFAGTAQRVYRLRPNLHPGAAPSGLARVR